VLFAGYTAIAASNAFKRATVQIARANASDLRRRQGVRLRARYSNNCFTGLNPPIVYLQSTQSTA
jgi:hypothetical protein